LEGPHENGGEQPLFVEMGRYGVSVKKSKMEMAKKQVFQKRDEKYSLAA